LEWLTKFGSTEAGFPSLVWVVGGAFSRVCSGFCEAALATA
jgi:hypothetical protein